MYIAPGNAGTGEVGENVALAATDFEGIKAFVLANAIDMVVVGPEDPLVKGIYDYFRDDEQLQGIPVIGPSKAGATLEGSKDFAKAFMMSTRLLMLLEEGNWIVACMLSGAVILIFIFFLFIDGSAKIRYFAYLSK